MTIEKHTNTKNRLQLQTATIVGFNNEQRCRQDGIAPQIGVNASGFVQNVFIPEANESIRNFLDAHYIDSYGWLFTDFDAKQTITKRNP